MNWKGTCMSWKIANFWKNPGRSSCITFSLHMVTKKSKIKMLSRKNAAKKVGTQVYDRQEIITTLFYFLCFFKALQVPPQTRTLFPMSKLVFFYSQHSVSFYKETRSGTSKKWSSSLFLYDTKSGLNKEILDTYTTMPTKLFMNRVQIYIGFATYLSLLHH